MNIPQTLDTLKTLQQETERAASEIAGVKVHVDFHLHQHGTDRDVRFKLAAEATRCGWSTHQSPTVPDICWVTDGERMTIFIDAEQYEAIKEQTDE